MTPRIRQLIMVAAAAAMMVTIVLQAGDPEPRLSFPWYVAGLVFLTLEAVGIAYGDWNRDTHSEFAIALPWPGTILMSGLHAYAGVLAIDSHYVGFDAAVVNTAAVLSIGAAWHFVELKARQIGVRKGA